MKKNILISLLLSFPMLLTAQGVWERPTFDDGKEEITTESSKSKEDEKYLKGAVTEVDGKVKWVLDLEVPGKSANEIYDIMLKYLNTLTKGEEQLPGSQVSLVNKEEQIIVATMKEWLLFKSTILALDRTKFNYVLKMECYDGRLKVELGRIKYIYGEQGSKIYTYKAEEWITDELAMNKKGTRLYRVSGKFRRRTIDRKDELFSEIREYLTKEK